MIKDYLFSLATDRKRGFIPEILKIFLFLLSLVYGAVVCLLIFFSRALAYRAKCKVISVGNLTLGGTGKTTVVEYIARILRDKGRKVVILSRGYKKPQEDLCGCQGNKEQKQYSTMGDEPYMLSQNLKDVPVLVDSDRIRAIEKAVKDFSADTIILDDGLQQWKIKKDLDIVVVDSTNPFGNGRLIPRGILRQPLWTLGKQETFVITKTDFAKDLTALRAGLEHLIPGSLIVEANHKPLAFYPLGNQENLIPIDKFKDSAVAIFSGIGEPKSFEKLITSLGIKASLIFTFADHHVYTKKEIEDILSAAKEKDIKTIITTQKDSVRIGRDILCDDAGVYVLRIGLDVNAN